MRPSSYIDQPVMCQLCKYSEWHRIETYGGAYCFCLYWETEFKEFVRTSEDFDKDWEEYETYFRSLAVCNQGSCDLFERKE